MFFKNLNIYRIVPYAELGLKLDEHKLQPCEPNDSIKIGWISPRGNDQLTHIVNNQILIALAAEEKILPSSVVKRHAAAKAKAIEEAEGRKVGRKEMRELVESAVADLLPRAFIRRRTTWAWIDPVNGWLVVDTTAPKKAEELLELLRKSSDIQIKLLQLKLSPSSAMTGWLAAGEVPGNFTIDQDLHLESAEHSQVKYVKHSLESDEIRLQIAAGKVARKLALTWADRISFVLTDTQQLKRVVFLDILKEQNESQADNSEELFDLDITLMAGELAKLFNDLVMVLGGEAKE